MEVTNWPIVYLVYRWFHSRLISTLMDLDEATQDEILKGFDPEEREKVLRKIGR